MDTIAWMLWTVKFVYFAERLLLSFANVSCAKDSCCAVGIGLSATSVMSALAFSDTLSPGRGRERMLGKVLVAVLQERESKFLT